MIKILKLITGEEIIGDVTEPVFAGSGLQVKQPCFIQLIPSQSNPGQTMMGLMPYASYVEDHTITISNEDVIWQGKPITELYNQYNRVFGSGIQLAGV